MLSFISSSLYEHIAFITAILSGGPYKKLLYFTLLGHVQNRLLLLALHHPIPASCPVHNTNPESQASFLSPLVPLRCTLLLSTGPAVFLILAAGVGVSEAWCSGTVLGTGEVWGCKSQGCLLHTLFGDKPRFSMLTQLFRYG